MPRRSTPATTCLWQQRLERFTHSDLVVADFCDQEAIPTTSFYAWEAPPGPEQSTTVGPPLFLSTEPQLCLTCRIPVGFSRKKSGPIAVMQSGTRVVGRRSVTCCRPHLDCT